ncbi:MAG: hypothetical protein HY735_16295 [Verrucomicrobia bacterium]|nr:hypothetical protein [Verrucomicrobiota bacterium]
MNAGLEILCHRLLASLCNATYQGLLIVLLTGLSLKILPRLNAATRHAVLFLTLLVVAGMPLLHFFWDASPQIAGTVHVQGQALEGGMDEGRISEFAPDQWTGRPDDSPWRVLSNADSGVLMADGGNPPRMLSSGNPEDTILWHEVQVAESAISSLATHWRGDQSGDTAGIVRSSPWLPRNWFLSLPKGLGVVLVAIWLAVATVRLAVLGRQCGWLRSLKHRGALAPEAAQALFARLSREMGLKRKVRLMTCADCPAPMVVGFRQPAVLFPEKFLAGETAPPAEQLLRHELAHVGRWDDWTNLLQQGIRAALFFNPAIWWLTRRLAVEREIACDDHVLAATRASRSYALLLTEFAGRMQCRNAAGAPAAWSNKNQLTERIDMILNSSRNSSPRPARTRAGVLAAAAAFVALLCLGIAPRLSFAADEAKTGNSTVAAADTKSQPAEPNLEPASESAPTLLTVTEELPAQPPLGPDTGPRPKPQPGAELSPLPPMPAPLTRPVPAHPRIAPPAAPVLPSAPMAAHRPMLPSRIGDDTAGPMLPRTPVRSTASARASTDRSLERRLERLEQLVESLIAKDKEPKKRTGGDFDFKFDLKGPEIAFDNDKLAKLAEDTAKLAEKFSKDALSEEAVARIRDQARREAELAKEQQAVRDAERAARDAERAAREMQRAMEMELKRAPAADPRALGRDSLKQRRQSLEAQRKSLERQMEAISRQIEQLHEQDQRLQQSIERQIEPPKRQPQLAPEPPGENRKRTKPLDSDEDSTKPKSP